MKQQELLMKYQGIMDTENRLFDSLVVECWLRVREVPGSIPSQGPCHTKDVIKMVPVVLLISTENPSKSEVIGRCGEDEKNE